MDEQALYANRFSDSESSARRRLWQVLVTDFLNQWIPTDGCVLDLGAGDCAFINAVNARRRIAVDVNPEVTASAAPGVEVVVGKLEPHRFSGECDLVMASNVFEHLATTDELLTLLHACAGVLRPDGRLIVLQPNFKYAYRNFYDYLDHSLPLTEASLSEALELAGFQIERVEPRFLPYSVKKQRITASWALRLYLRLKPLWRVFGKQMLIVAKANAHAGHRTKEL